MHAVHEFAKLALGLGLFAATFGAWLLVIFTTFQFFLDAVKLQFFLEEANGLLNIASDFNCDHLVSCSSGIFHQRTVSAIHFVAGKSGLYTRKEKQLSTKNSFFSGFRSRNNSLPRRKVREGENREFKDEGGKEAGQVWFW